ncbi:MAG: hypothetical protein K0Q59_4174 [Paenibacillus sp.]|jgi:hypothetical protein|nr:hypothetical protein [Paenibacillus sp.]
MAATIRWEYSSAERFEELRQLGAEGWELVGVTEVDGRERFYLKRPLPSLREQFTLDQRKQALAVNGEGAER